MANATYDADALAWFHASHNNLGATALSADATGVSALVTRLNALMAQGWGRDDTASLLRVLELS